MATTLRELGERYLLRHIIPEYCASAGDDCASIGFDGCDIVVTTDPVPNPAAHILGGDADPYWMGWLLVVINASDLAAAGASPLAFLGALEIEPERSLEDFRRLLAGIRDSCANEGLAYVGGNLREGSRLGGVGTAIGRATHGEVLSRHGALPGDLLMSIGPGGVFWRDVFTALRRGIIPDKLKSPVFSPHSQIRVMHALAKQGLIHAAIDNSDGLLPSLQQLAVANAVSVTLDTAPLSVADSAELAIDPARLWLGWGDWNVLVAVEPGKLRAVLETGLGLGVEVTTIGNFKNGGAQVFIDRGGKTDPAPRLESERFAADSWFSEGIQGYIDRLLSVNLPE
jgi:thiamine-monophosphate kinase